MNIKAKMTKPSKWKGLLVAERNIIRIFVFIPLAYLISHMFVSFVNNFLPNGQISPEGWRGFLHDLDIIWRIHFGWYFGVIIVLMFIYMLIAFSIGWKYRPQLKLFPPPTDLQIQKKKPKKDKRIFNHWQKIVQRANTGNQENMKSAIIEADALAGQHLKNSGFDGEHLAEMLSRVDKKRVKSIERVWKAHKLRNEIVHSPGTKISTKQAEASLLAYRDFFKETGVF